MTSTARDAAEAVGDSPVLRWGARLGYAASGLLHLVMGWIAFEVAWGSTSQEADQTGALQNLAGTGMGSLLLWVVAIAFALLALWQLTEAIARRKIGDRLKAAGKFGLYAFLAWTAVTVVEGRSTGSDDTSGMTASIMAESYGRALVAVVGLGVVGMGGYHVVWGWRKTFLRDLREHPGTWLVRAARVGYVAKGIAGDRRRAVRGGRRHHGPREGRGPRRRTAIVARGSHGPGPPHPDRPGAGGVRGVLVRPGPLRAGLTQLATCRGACAATSRRR